MDGEVLEEDPCRVSFLNWCLACVFRRPSSSGFHVLKQVPWWHFHWYTFFDVLIRIVWYYVWVTLCKSSDSGSRQGAAGMKVNPTPGMWWLQPRQISAPFRVAGSLSINQEASWTLRGTVMYEGPGLVSLKMIWTVSRSSHSMSWISEWEPVQVPRDGTLHMSTVPALRRTVVEAGRWPTSQVTLLAQLVSASCTVYVFSMGINPWIKHLHSLCSFHRSKCMSLLQTRLTQFFILHFLCPWPTSWAIAIIHELMWSLATSLSTQSECQIHHSELYLLVRDFSTLVLFRQNPIEVSITHPLSATLT